MDPCAIESCPRPPEAWIVDTRNDYARHHVCADHRRAWDDHYAARAANRSPVPPLPPLRGPVARVAVQAIVEIPMPRAEVIDVEPPPAATRRSLPCRWPGCDRLGDKARGLCGSHYARAHKEGRLDEVGLPPVVMPAPEEPMAAPTLPAPPAETMPPLARRVSDMERRAEAARALLLMDTCPEGQKPEIEGYDEGAFFWRSEPFDSPVEDRSELPDWLRAEIRAVLDDVAPLVSQRLRARLEWLAFRPLADVPDDTPPPFDHRADAILEALKAEPCWHSFSGLRARGFEEDDLAWLVARRMIADGPGGYADKRWAEDEARRAAAKKPA